MIMRSIKSQMNRPGLLGYISSLIYFSYGGGIKVGLELARDRQGFDLFYGVDTFDKRYIIEHEDGQFAEASTPDKVKRIKTAISFMDGIVAMEKTTFIDFGCGKGRALIVASKFGFQKLVGIELSQHAMDVCRKNLKKLSIPCSFLNESISDINYSTISIRTKNVIIYAYNPTTLSIIAKSCNKLIHDYPCLEIFLIYSNPQGSISTDMIPTIKLIGREHKLDMYKLSLD